MAAASAARTSSTVYARVVQRGSGEDVEGTRRTYDLATLPAPLGRTRSITAAGQHAGVSHQVA
jgi:hypothetical protein